MSSVVPLGFELEDLTGEPYITKPKTIKGFRKRIGLRWQGQMAFEDEHQKKFPYQLMFNALKDIDADFISLQRDEGAEACPRGLSRFHSILGKTLDRLRPRVIWLYLLALQSVI